MVHVATHTPVMLCEAMGLLNVHRGGVFVDATLGGGGHTRALCEAVCDEGRVIALDKDLDAVAAARQDLAPRFPWLTLIHADFRSMAEVVGELCGNGVDGVLMDLGVSSMQLDPASGRGFSFQGDEPLDMRLDYTTGVDAARVLAQMDEQELEDVLRTYGEERYARRVARAIAHARAESPIRTTGQLAQIVRGVVPSSKDGLDPATRTFMAIRIYVNQELEALNTGLLGALRILRPRGRLVVLAYHSGEDRVVKRFIATQAKGCTCPASAPICTCGGQPTLKPLVRRPLRPSPVEIAANPRARSCRLRAAEKLEESGTHGDL